MHQLVALHIAHLKQEGRSPDTIREARLSLARLDAALSLGLTQTSRAELQGYLANDQWKETTRKCYFFHAKRFYDWATDEDVDLLDSNPMARMKPPTPRKGRPRPLAEHELEAVLTRAINPFRLCAIIALDTGLRCCEIAGLRREDIGDEDVFVRRAKGGASDTVPGRPAMLLEEVRDFPRGLLVEHVGGVADATWISTRAANYFRFKLGLPGVTMHRFRHHYAKRLRDAGHDPFVIKRNLRHQSLSNTEIYVGATDRECREAVRGLAALPALTSAAC